MISFVTFLGEQSCDETRKSSRQDCCCFDNKTQHYCSYIFVKGVQKDLVCGKRVKFLDDEDDDDDA